MSESTFIAAVERVWRRVLLVVGRGRVTTGDDSGAVQKLQVKLSADEIRDNTPRLAEYGFASNPLPGADAVVLFVAGDRSNAVVIATGDQRYRMHLTPGEVALHDDQGQSVYITRSGIVINGGGKAVKVTNTPEVRMECDLKVTGDITDHCDTTGRSMAADRVIYNSHDHNDPQGGVTGIPNQQE